LEFGIHACMGVIACGLEPGGVTLGNLKEVIDNLNDSFRMETNHYHIGALRREDEVLMQDLVRNGYDFRSRKFKENR